MIVTAYDSYVGIEGHEEELLHAYACGDLHYLTSCFQIFGKLCPPFLGKNAVFLTWLHYF